MAGRKKVENVRKLQRINVYDDMDWACKERDIYYTRVGLNSLVCDELLLYLLDH